MATPFDQFLQAVAQMESSGSQTGNTFGLTSQGGFGTSLQQSGVGGQYSAALSLAQSNFNSLTTSLGQAPTGFQQYVAWQQGATGGANLLAANPNAPANSIVPTANLIGNLPASMQGAAASGQLTVGQFLGNLSNQWTAAGGQGSYAGASQASLSAASGAGASGAGNTGATPVAIGAGDWIANYFGRAVVIILGFIFVNSGLHMFGAGVPLAPVAARAIPAKRQRISMSHSGMPATVKLESGPAPRGGGTVKAHRVAHQQGMMLRQVQRKSLPAAKKKAPVKGAGPKVLGTVGHPETGKQKAFVTVKKK